MEPVTQVSPTPTETPAANPVTEPVQAPAGTAEPSIGQAPDAGAGAAPGEETFFSGDPKSLPPELQQAYTNMLKDYKKKTGELAESRKALPDLQKKAQAYDQLTSDQRFKEYWSGLNRSQKADFKEQKAEAEKKLGEKITDDEFAKAFNSKDDFLALMARVVEEKHAKSQQRIAELEQKTTLNEAADIVEGVATEVDKATGKPARPDFYALDEDGLITGYLRVNPAESTDQYQARVLEAYNWAKQTTQKYYEKGKAEALEIIRQKAANSTEPPTNAAKNVYQGPDPKNLSASEAVAMARKGQRVPQDY